MERYVRKFLEGCCAVPDVGKKESPPMSVAPLKQGPLLRGLLAAQQESETAVAFPDIEQWANALVSLSTKLGDPLLLPVTGPAERLVGAAVAAARGRLRV